MPARPRKSSRGSVAAAFQGLWKITTHIWHQALTPMTLFQHQRMRPFSGLLGPGGFNSLYQMSFQQWNHFSPCGDSPFPPDHCQISSCRVAAFVLPLFTVLMEFKPSPFSLFSLVPVAIYNFLLSLQLLLGRGAFPIFYPHPHLHPLSSGKSGSLPSTGSLSPSSPLHTAYLLNSVLQVVQIVVLILQSVY